MIQKLTAILMIVLLEAPPLFAATRYLRTGASGAANGSNWTDAYTTFSAAETAAARGDLVYVAGGNYGTGSIVFNTAASGTSTIEFRRATVADHGTETGWSAAYDAQIITGKLDIDTGYWIINGVTGHGSSLYYTLTEYGWKVNVTDAVGLQFDVGVDGIQLKFLEVDGNGSGTTSNDGLRANQGGEGWLISHLWIHDFDRCAFKIGGAVSGNGDADNWTIEHCFTDSHSKNSSIHSEMASVRGTLKFVWRNNFHYGFKSTGCLIIGNGIGWEVYGNIFANDAGSANNGAIGTWSSSGGYSVQDFKIHNNTFWDLANAAKRIFPISNDSSGHTVTDNLWVDCAGTTSAFGGGTSGHNYNGFYNHAATESEANIQTSFAQNPLSNPATGDFRLAIATTAGTATTFTTDPLGVTRGDDGTWDRGAFEFDAGGEADVTDPVISNVSHGTPTATSATITWNTDEASDSEVEYGLTAGHGSSESSATLVTSHSIQLSGLTAGTLYHYRVISCDGSSNCAESSDGTFTTASSDSTDPVVAITAPADAATVSEIIAFTATATDNESVVDVKFYVDDVLINTDTEFAYGFNWNSRTVANGSRVLTAIASDPSGNTATNEVTVTVSNVTRSFVVEGTFTITGGRITITETQ